VSVRSLRLGPLWRGLAWLLLAGAILLSLGPTQAIDTAWIMPFPYHDKLGHFLAYMGLMLWFAGLYRREYYPLVAQYLFLLGMLMELTQGSLPHRSAEFGDLVANSAGIAAGWSLAAAGMGNWCVWVERRIGLQHA
jgi:VanZ family protein